MDYSPDNALILGNMAQLAYDDEAAVKRIGKDRLGFESVEFFSTQGTPGTQVFVGSTTEMIGVAFRGTEPRQIEDWIVDAMIEQVQGPRGKVHTGFQVALDAVWEDIRAAISRLQDNGQSIWFTGHSLGAALATLSTARLRLSEDKPVHGLYTFGSPRVGDREFSEAFNLDFEPHSFRFVNNQDIVTRLPLRSMGYSHIGTTRRFDENGNLGMYRAMWFDFLNEFVEDAMVWVREAIDENIMNRFADHSMDEYVRLLERHVASTD